MHVKRNEKNWNIFPANPYVLIGKTHKKLVALYDFEMWKSGRNELNVRTFYSASYNETLNVEFETLVKKKPSEDYTFRTF